MSDDIGLFLSDEFVHFSKKIAEVHAKKKEMQVKLKEVYAKFQKEGTKLDEEAKLLQSDWETWKAAYGKEGHE